MVDAALAPVRATERAEGMWVVPPLAILGILFFYPLALIARQALYGGTDTL